MKPKFQRPDMVDAIRGTQNYIFILEIVIFIGIFYLTQLVASVPQAITMMVYGVFCGLTSPGIDPLTLQQKLMVDTTPIILLTQIIPIGLTLAFCMAFWRRKPWTLGFKKRNLLREYAVGAGLGFGLMSLIAVVALVTGSMVCFPDFRHLGIVTFLILPVYLVGYLIQGMSEEVLFRGYLIPALARKKDRYWLAILVSAVLFALAHSLNSGITLLAMFNLTLFGIFAGVYFLKRGDIWGIGALHSLWNFTQGNVWGVLVSGMEPGPCLVHCFWAPGGQLLSGGDFGLEGGLITTAVLTIAILVALCLPQKDTAPVIPETVTPVPASPEN